MSVHAAQLRTSTPGDGAVIDLTEGVVAIVRQSGVDVGVASVFIGGATAAITTIEHEPGAIADLGDALERIAPADAAYRHNELNGDTNGHAHVRAAIIGPSVSIPVVGGRPALGTWQRVVLVDFDDRPRERAVDVHVWS